VRAATRPRSTRMVTRVCASAAVLTFAVACGGTGDDLPSPTPTPSPSTTASSPTPTPTPTPSTTTGSPTTSPTRTPSPTPTTPVPTTASPSPTPTSIPVWLAGKDVRIVPTTKKLVVLTFDGGGNADGLAKILSTLAAKHVPGTFFVTGRWVQVYPAGSRAIVAAGHVVGNHTMTHPHSTEISDAALTAEVLDAARVIRTVTGVSPKPWFRFPYGERTSADIRLLNSLGYVCVSWSVDTLGWLGTSRGTAADVVQRVLDELEPGLIVLMHVGSNPDDGTTYDADALGPLIDALRARGYTFGTVTELLRP
jgi:peptidoglycan/xylan/chitin deacetylase (PgdA/CDA1 family)